MTMKMNRTIKPMIQCNPAKTYTTKACADKIINILTIIPIT